MLAGCWILRPRFDPEETACVAAFSTAAVGALPHLGTQTWKYHDGTSWARRDLDIKYLDAAEVRELGYVALSTSVHRSM
eukprot:COSAG02_NODE_19201_length_895_cov_0.763819_1_plen_79_part_00